MFSKKKKGDAKPDGAAAPAGADSVAAPAAEPAAAPPSPAPAPAAPAESGAESSEAKSGGLAGGGFGKAKSSGVAASRLGRPPSRPSAPEPERPASAPAPAPAPAAPSPAAPPPASVHSEAEMSTSGRNVAMQSSSGMIQPPAEAASGDGKKNPYKLNPLFDVILPVSMAAILCGGFAMTTKVQKQKHDIYGLSQDEIATQVRIPALAAAAVMDEIRKMPPVKLLDSGDTAGALAAAKTMGAAAYNLAKDKGMGNIESGDAAPPKEVLALEEKTVRELCAAGMVLSKAGAKADREMGLNYLQKASEIATYSKFVRVTYARELVRAHNDEEAIKQYQKIVELFKEPWPLAHKELGLLYMRNNHGPEAVAELTEVTKEDPADPSIQRQLGLAMAQGGDQQAGFDEFQKGFTKEGDVLSFPAAVKPLVDAHGGLVDATLQDVKKQAEKNPEDIKLQLDLARLDIATGKIKEARDLMEKARKTQELNPEVHEVMAEIMVRQNQAQSGYDEFRSAVQNLHLQQ